MAQRGSWLFKKSVALSPSKKPKFKGIAFITSKTMKMQPSERTLKTFVSYYVIMYYNKQDDRIYLGIFPAVSFTYTKI